MSVSVDIDWPTFDAIAGAAGAGMLVSVAATKGSTPREVGAAMLVTPDGLSGSIGGGKLEYVATQEARRLLVSGDAADVRAMALGPRLGQCCGGQAEVLYERVVPAQMALPDMDDKAAERAVVLSEIDPPRPLRVVAAGEAGDWAAEAAGCLEDGVPRIARLADGRAALIRPYWPPRQPLALFGAGHVGTALVRALTPLPFRITWIDSRAEWLVPPEGGGVRTELRADPAAAVEGLPPGMAALVMTHSHALDEAICTNWLMRNDFVYLGLIGSASKRASFFKRLAARGFAQEAIDRIHCPIGLPGLDSKMTGGKAPAVIAASVAADLLLRIADMRARSYHAAQAAA